MCFCADVITSSNFDGAELPPIKKPCGGALFGGASTTRFAFAVVLSDSPTSSIGITSDAITVTAAMYVRILLEERREKRGFNMSRKILFFCPKQESLRETHCTRSGQTVVDNDAIPVRFDRY